MLRLAVVGTPRSGNTWLRRVLATAYALDGERGRELAVHDPAQVGWETEGPRYIVQVHVRRTPEMVRTFSRHGVRVVVPRRHPFDVLISVLQYVQHVPDTGQWLLGEAGDETGLRGLHPCHPAFLDYARGPRAAALLAVSREWADLPGAIPLGYEDLVTKPSVVLDGLASAVGQPPVIEWAEALRTNSMDRLRQTHGFGHIWQGRPGHWRTLLTRDAARVLAEAHPDLVAAYAEAADGSAADPSLSPEQALANWRALNPSCPA